MSARYCSWNFLIGGMRQDCIRTPSTALATGSNAKPCFGCHCQASVVPFADEMRSVSIHPLRRRLQWREKVPSGSKPLGTKAPLPRSPSPIACFLSVRFLHRYQLLNRYAAPCDLGVKVPSGVAGVARPVALMPVRPLDRLMRDLAGVSSEPLVLACVPG